MDSATVRLWCGGRKKAGSGLAVKNWAREHWECGQRLGRRWPRAGDSDRRVRAQSKSDASRGEPCQANVCYNCEGTRTVKHRTSAPAQTSTTPTRFAWLFRGRNQHQQPRKKMGTTLTSALPSGRRPPKWRRTKADDAHTSGMVSGGRSDYPETLADEPLAPVSLIILLRTSPLAPRLPPDEQFAAVATILFPTQIRRAQSVRSFSSSCPFSGHSR